MKRLNRTIKFAVTFRGWRGADLRGKDGLYAQLHAAQEDLTRAANRLLFMLLQVRAGILVVPPDPGKEGGPPIQTLSYRGLAGLWQPAGRPMYAPRGRKVGSRVILDLAGLVMTRLETDFDGVMRGDAQAPTFREVPIGCTMHGVTVNPDLSVTMKVWSSEKRRGGDVTLAPHRIDPSQRAILRRIADGTNGYKQGGARLAWDERKHKWMLSLSWSGDTEAPGGTLIAGVHVGREAVTIAYLEADGSVSPRRDVLHVPENVLRAVDRVGAERAGRLRFNREVFDLRTGQGTDRKLRVVRAINDRVDRVVSDAVRQTAAATVATLKRAGASAVVVLDLSWLPERVMQQTDGMGRRERVSARKRFFRWHQGAVRAAIREAAEREGIVVRVPKTRHIPTEPCGIKCHPDRNIAINIARLGIEKAAAAK